MSAKRVAVVTGAARGIGRSVVLELLQQGREVVGIDINEEQLKELESAAKEAGYSCKSCCVDITDSEAFEQELERIAEEEGSIDILINNAGITRDGLIMRMSDEDFDKVISVNLRAAFVAIRTVSRHMIRNKFGRIVSLSSVSGLIGNAGQSNYSSSKAGLVGLTKTVAREFARKNVTANCVAPGFIETAMTEKLPDAVKEGAKKLIPLRRMGKPEDVANAISFLASDEAGYITGQVLCVDGGMAM